MTVVAASIYVLNKCRSCDRIKVQTCYFSHKTHCFISPDAFPELSCRRIRESLWDIGLGSSVI